MQLQKYDFTVKFKPGKSMHVSDLLSRKNLPETEECVPDISPAEPSVDLDLEYIENVFTYLER